MVPVREAHLGDGVFSRPPCYDSTDSATVTLGLRLLLAFATLALGATFLVGMVVRAAATDIIQQDFAARVDTAGEVARLKLSEEIGAFESLITPLCSHDTFVDRAQVELETVKGKPEALDAGTRIALRHLVAEQARALRVDELSLVAADGLILGAEDPTKAGVRDARLFKLISRNEPKPALRNAEGAGGPLVEVSCVKSGKPLVGLVAALRLSTLLAHIGSIQGASLEIANRGSGIDDGARFSRTIAVPELPALSISVSLPRDQLDHALEKLDEGIGVAGGVVLAIALAIAFVLSRSLSRPIVALSEQTKRIAEGNPSEVAVQGSREIVELAESFNAAIRELSKARKQLAVTERIAARRDVARQIAHEIKNPLAPIRAAVETLRRLRARGDVAFDGYFDEATATVLDEVHRIASIVSEFTRHERLPPPNLARINIAQVVRSVVNLYEPQGNDLAAVHDGPSLELSTMDAMIDVMADKDQLVQVLTNLIQNALDAAGHLGKGGRVTVTVLRLERDVVISVSDNGEGVPEEMVGRLFEPYATSKPTGTGLGLAIAKRIAHEHGGDLSHVRTASGACFELTLPIDGPSSLAKKESAEETPLRYST